jgi:hypothetical protein
MAASGLTELEISIDREALLGQEEVRGLEAGGPSAQRCERTDAHESGFFARDAG